MPLCLDPNQRVTIWLKSDEHLPLAERPVFKFRPSTLSVQLRISAILDRIGDLEQRAAMTSESITDDLMDVLRERMTGWANMRPPDAKKSMPFDLAKLPELLTFDEAFELVVKLLRHERPSDDEKKASASPP